MAGSEDARVAEAYVTIKAERAATFREDVKAIGEEYGEQAGGTASSEFNDEFRKGTTGSKAKSERARDGEVIGGAVGAAAGSKAGDSLVSGAATRLRNSRGQFIKAGEDIGGQLGAAAGERFTRDVNGRLRDARGKFVKDGDRIGRDLGDEAGRGFMSGFFARLSSIRSRLDKALRSDFTKGVKKFDPASLAVKDPKIAAIGGGSALGITNAGQVAQLGQLSGAIGLLPGVMTAAATSGIALKLSLHGVSDAFKDADDPKKYAADMADLAPAARTFVRSIESQRTALTGLRKTVQQSFFSGFVADIKPLVGDYLPRFKNTLSDISGFFGQAVGGVTSFLKSAEGISDVDAILGNVDDAALGVSSALGPIVVGLIKIAKVSSDFLPGLTSGFGEAGVKVGAFLDRITKGGKDSTFGQWISRSGDELHTLESDFSSLVNGFDDPRLQNAGRTIFDGLKAGVRDVEKDFPKIVTAVERLAPAIGGALKGGGASFGNTLALYARTAIVLAPAINGIVSALGPLAPVLGVVVPLLKGASLAFKGWSVLTSVIDGVQGLAVAVGALDVALDANVIGLVVIGLVALGAGLTVAWKKSQAFRDVVIGAFKLVANGVLGQLDIILGVLQGFFAILGHLPGKLGAPFRAAADAIGDARNKVNQLRESINLLHGKTIHVDTIYTIKSTGGPGGGRVPIGSFAGGRIPPPRRAPGGFIPPSLGAPRQDNVLALLSGGEFVVNAFAASRPGVASVLGVINASGQVPRSAMQLASGGRAGTLTQAGSAGLNDITDGRPRYITRTEAIQVPSGPARLHPDDIAALAQALGAVVGRQRIVLDTGQIAGAVNRYGGRNF